MAYQTPRTPLSDAGQVSNEEALKYSLEAQHVDRSKVLTPNLLSQVLANSCPTIQNSMAIVQWASVIAAIFPASKVM